MLRTMAAIGLGRAGLAGATSAEADSRPVVVELFTSQGCSSCPPADALLRDLSGRSDVLALGFHISYWDDLGWKDPFSSEAATDRQRAYARLFGRGQIYTPQMVVDGRREMVGSDRDAVGAALSSAHPEALCPVSFGADRRSVALGSGSGNGTVLLARFVQKRVTRVGAGENARRTLEDVNGVEALSTLGRWDGSAQHFAIQPPAAGEGVAVLVQAADGRILGAGSTLATP